MWQEQELAFKTFIKILENSLVDWAREKSLPKKILFLLESSIKQLKIINGKIGGKNLKKQISKINELMTFIARNSGKMLSDKIEREIMRLKAELEKQQENILLVG